MVQGFVGMTNTCSTCHWVGYCGGHYEYICDLKITIIKEFAKKLGITTVLENWFIDPEPCEFYIRSEKTITEIKKFGMGRIKEEV